MHVIQYSKNCQHNSTQTIIPRRQRQADFNASPLAEHVWTEQHQVDWSNVAVVSNPIETSQPDL